MKIQFSESSPAHLFLLPLYYVTHKFPVLCRPFDPERLNSAADWAGNFLLSLFLSVIPGCVFFIFLRKGLKVEKVRAAVITTLFAIVFFLESELEFFSKFDVPLIRKRYLLVIAFMLIGFLVVKTSRHPKLTLHLNSYLNLLWSVLIFYNVIVLATVIPQIKINSFISKDSSFTASCTDCPDIYYILLDAYTGNESLRKFWKYDNSPFTDSLRSLGFYIAESRTKFTQTYYSMASTLNMSDDSAAINRMHRYEAMEMVKNNLVTKKLSEAGYEIVNLSFFDIGNSSPYYDFSNASESKERSVFNRFLNNTVLKSIADLFSEMNTYEQHLKTLDGLKAVAARQKDHPTFVYFHLLAPHQPYVMDSMAHEVPFYKIPKSNSKSGYLGQLKGLNKLILKAVREILSHYHQPALPVILIQGDHGFRYLPDHPEESATILNAYHLPKGNDKLYPEISPYNTFRVLFNTYFNTHLTLLGDTRPKLTK